MTTYTIRESTNFIFKSGTSGNCSAATQSMSANQRLTVYSHQQIDLMSHDYSCQRQGKKHSNDVVCTHMPDIAKWHNSLLIA